MRYIASKISLLVVFFSSTSSYAQKLPTGNIGQFVRDVGTLRLEIIGSDANAMWIVGDIKPDKSSGTLFVKSGYIDADTGRFVRKGKEEDYVKTSGVFRVITPLAGQKMLKVLPYSWRESPQARTRSRDSLQTRQITATFNTGATVIAQVDLTQKGRAQFASLYAIPQPWKTLVAPAYRFYRSDPSLLDARNAEKNEVRLRNLLEVENPFIAIAACQVLADAKKLDRSFVIGPLSNARGLRQAIFAFVFTLQGASELPYRELETNAQFVPLADALARKQTAAGLRNLLLGVSVAGAAELYDPFDHKTPLKGFSTALLRAVAKRARELKLPTEPRSRDERDISAVLRRVKLR